MNPKQKFLKALENLEIARILLEDINCYQLKYDINTITDVLEDLNQLPKDDSYWSDFE